ncbi:restriction endonuclease subunit S [Desulfitobacterium sp. Sab5]|uniref:restriction endonuclease subunit S n=1 Tax=Desulfitobacterium nosdiversum TaxID=3375356 RepID=UPI003CFB74E8
MESSKELPFNWVVAQLGEVANYENGKAFKPTEWEGKGLPIIRIQNLNNPDAKYHYTTGVYEGKYKVSKGDLLFAWSASLGAYIWNNGEAWLNQHIFKVLPQKFIDKKYLYYLLDNIVIRLYSETHGSGMVHITKGKFEANEIPLPPLPEQHRIVAKIEELFSELDKGVESLKTALQQLKVYRQAVLKCAFEGKLTEEWRKAQKGLHNAKELLEKINTDIEKKEKDSTINVKFELTFDENVKLPLIPSIWQWLKLKNIAELVGGITKGRDFKDKKTISLPYLRVANVQDGYLDLKEIKDIELLESEKEKYLLRENDILYTEGGDKDKLGRGTIWKNEIIECVHQNHIFRARIYREFFVPKYIAYYSQSETAKKYFYRKAKQTVNLASINMTVLGNLLVPIPSKKEQSQIVQEIEFRLSVCDKIQESIVQSLDKAEALRQSILKKAFEGKLVPQDPNEEPAEKLLERIRAEKEAQ